MPSVPRTVRITRNMDRILWLLLVATLRVSFTTANYYQEHERCLDCICKVESNCQNLKCSDDEGSDSCGYYQIKLLYWKDCRVKSRRCTNDTDCWKKCALDETCSRRCVEKYMSKYANWKGSGCMPGCEGYARLHNGGPSGCKKRATEKYWKKVKGCLSPPVKKELGAATALLSKKGK